jgi:GT2 family glycosyltransferase
MPTVSILICTHNRAELLKRTIDSLCQLALPKDVPVELVLVANACTDHTATVMADAAGRLAFPVKCFVEPTPGVSIARNRALAESSGEILAFLDDDVWADSQWLVALIRAFEDQPADIVGGHADLWWEILPQPEWFNPGYRWVLSGCDFGSKVFQMHDTDGAIGANFAARRKVFETIGNFRVDLGRAGKEMTAGEETDVIERALAAGFKAFHVPDVIIKHWVPAARSTPEYVCSAMAGFTRSDVMRKTRFGPAVAARSLGGNCFLWSRHSAGQLLAKMRGDFPAAVRHQIRVAAARGALSGGIHRIFSRGQPIEANRPNFNNQASLGSAPVNASAPVPASAPASAASAPASAASAPVTASAIVAVNAQASASSTAVNSMPARSDIHQ